MASKHLKEEEEEEEEKVIGIESPSKRRKTSMHVDDVVVKNMDVVEEYEYDWLNDILMYDDSVPISLNEVMGSSTAAFGFDSNDQDFFSLLDNVKEEDLFGSMDEEEEDGYDDWINDMLMYDDSVPIRLDEEDRFATSGKKAGGMKGGLDQQSGNSTSKFDSGDISNAFIRKSSSYVHSYVSINISTTATITRQEEGLVVVPCATTSRRRGNWVLVGPDMLPGAELCPASVKDYLLGVSDNSTTAKVRMHISYLGWKIECSKRDGAKSNSITKIRYTSPDNKTFYSLADVCRSIEQPATSSSRDSVTDTKNGVSVANKDVYASGVCRLSGGKLASVEEEEEYNDIKPKYCPQALIAWVNYNSGSDESKRKEIKKSGGSARSMALRAKEHLRAVGWGIYPVLKQGTKKEARYRSPLPPNPSFSSLVTACKRCMKDSNLSESRL